MKHFVGFGPALAERSLAPCRITYEHLAPVKVLRKELGLTPNDIAVMTALISFLPRDKADAPQQSGLTIVFPSNETLSERCNGLDERTIRRCIARLVAAGLIARKTSANQKRFPLRFGGVIRDAFGFDLLPLAKGHEALSKRAAQVIQTDKDLCAMRAKAQALRAMVARLPNQEAPLEAMRNALRRSSLTIDEVAAMILQLEESLSNTATKTACAEVDTPNQTTEHMTATNGQNVRHKEIQKKEFKEKENLADSTLSIPLKPGQGAKAPSMQADPGEMAWEDFSHISSFFPDEPRSAKSLVDILHHLGEMLRLSKAKLHQSLATSNPGRILLAFNCMLSRYPTIRNPDGYFTRLLRDGFAPS